MLGACLLVASVVGSVAANAGPRAVHLVYNRGAGAEQCPSQAELQQGITARLGRDPFWGRGARQVWITISRSGTELVATIAAQAEDGGAAQVRAVTSRRAECGELASAVELAMAIAIDPVAAMGRPSQAPGDIGEPFQPPSAPTGSVAPASGAPGAPEAAALRTTRRTATPEALSGRDLHWFVGAGLLLSTRAGPGTSAGLALDLGARRGAWSLTLEGRVDDPTEADGGAISASLVLAAAVPCYHVRWLAACAVAAAGILRGSAAPDLPDAQVDMTPYCAAGARVAAELPVSGRFALGAHFDVLATLTPTHLRVAQLEVWSTPVASLTLGLSAIERFW
jgi:hypothetical protein